MHVAVQALVSNSTEVLEARLRAHRRRPGDLELEVSQRATCNIATCNILCSVHHSSVQHTMCNIQCATRNMACQPTVLHVHDAGRCTKCAWCVVRARCTKCASGSSTRTRRGSSGTYSRSRSARTCSRRRLCAPWPRYVRRLLTEALVSPALPKQRAECEYYSVARGWAA